MKINSGRSAFAFGIFLLIVGVLAADAKESSKPVSAVPSNIRLQETKVKGSKYECHINASLDGRGTMDGFKAVEGGAYFTYRTDLAWTSEILVNDGVTLIEKRKFEKSIGTANLSVMSLGLTEATTSMVAEGLQDAALAAGAGPGLGWVARAAGELAQSDRLLKVPVLGAKIKSVAEDTATEYGPNQAISFVVKSLDHLEGTELTLTWKNGKLDSYKIITPGVALTPEAIACASRAGAFCDVSLFPQSEKRPGDGWVVAAKDVADYFNAEPDLRESVTGTLQITRSEDERPGEIAVLKGVGNASYEGEKYSGEVQIETLLAKFHYAGTKDKTNQYLSYCETNGVATVSKLEAGTILYGLRITAQPKLHVTYSCIER